MTQPPEHYDYAVLRVVPRVDRGEFINAGVIVCCRRRDYLRAAVALDVKRLLALDPAADLAAIDSALQAVVRICEGGPVAGALGRLSLRERFDWLVAPRSSSVQTSAVHSGRCGAIGDLDATLSHLMQRMVSVPPPATV